MPTPLKKLTYKEVTRMKRRGCKWKYTIGAMEESLQKQIFKPQQ
jgi:hypothetical protein